MFNEHLFNEEINFISMIIVLNFSNQSKISFYIFIHFNTFYSFSLSNYLLIQRIIFENIFFIPYTPIFLYSLHSLFPLQLIFSVSSCKFETIFF
jgi:hypothetical protein